MHVPFSKRMRTRGALTFLLIGIIGGQPSPAAALPGPVADVSVNAGASPQAVPPGSTVSFGITVANGGPFDAVNVALRVEIPANTTFVSWGNVSESGQEVAAR